MLAALPQYLLWFGLCILIWGLSIVAYWLITPINELKLIRKGDTAAAVSFGGAAIGLALPLASIASSIQEVPELLLWGALSLACQLAIFFAAMLIFPQFKRGISENKMSYGVMVAALSIGMGLINAGALNS